MPTGTWFNAVTPAGHTAWLGVDAMTLRLEPIFLDLASGKRTYTVWGGDSPARGATIYIDDQSIAYSTGIFTSGNGTITLYPVSVGTTTINIGRTASYTGTSSTITVTDSRVSSSLVVTPVSPINLNLMTGGVTLSAIYNGKPIKGLSVVSSNPEIISVIDDESDYNGHIRIEPRAIGEATVTITMTETEEYPLTVNGLPMTVNRKPLVVTGINDVVTVKFTVISTFPLYYPTTLRIAPWTPMDVHRLCDGPFTIHVVDQIFRSLPVRDYRRNIEAEVSLPGYVSVSAHSLGGKFRVVPRSVGVGKIKFTYHTPEGKLLYMEHRFEIVP